MNNDEIKFLNMVINLCDNLAFGRAADESTLFSLTRQGSAPEPLVRLAEAFGMMMVKVEAREFHRTELIKALQARNAELEEARRLLAERNIHLARNLQEEYQANRIIGQCEAMQNVVRLAMSLANRPINTLILGPTGAGKEIIAKAIHFNSSRREGPFIAVNCTAIPESLFESEMFGIEKGVATGVQARKGMIEEADGGTLFLDEIADMSLANQAKLLRVLEERELCRLGSSKPISVDIKVVAATHADLYQSVRDGKFREDLYYRINVAELRLPPLRERGEDVILLAQTFLERHCVNMGRPKLKLSPEARRRLLTYAWPGNVRELNNEMERAAALTLSDVVEEGDLSPRLLNAAGAGQAAGIPAQTPSAGTGLGGGTPSLPPPDLPLNLQEAEQILVREALKESGGNKSRAAELLGITREGLRKKLLRLEWEQ